MIFPAWRSRTWGGHRGSSFVVSTSDDQAVVVGHRVEPARWQAETDRLLEEVAGRFARVETRRRARGFLLGRKNCWSIAEHAGDSDTHGMQYLLNRAIWDTDGVRDDLRDYVTNGLGDSDAVLVVDETGDVKKGVCTVGVQRQYTGTAGRIENAQVAVYLTYVGARGHAMIDRELYLPKFWITDPDRLAEAGVPEDIEFLTKPALAAGMLTRALNAGAPARWVAGDEVYGADPDLRAELEAYRVGYVLAIGCDRRVRTGAGLLRADQLTAALPKRAWQRLSAGPGVKGQRYYDGPWSPSPSLMARPPAPTPTAGGYWCGATPAPLSWRSTAATHPSWSRCVSWSVSPACVRRWRNRSRPARAWPAWMNTRSAAGAPGNAGRCSR
jgi:hypothetical protein